MPVVGGGYVQDFSHSVYRNISERPILIDFCARLKAMNMLDQCKNMILERLEHWCAGMCQELQR